MPSDAAPIGIVLGAKKDDLVLDRGGRRQEEVEMAGETGAILAV